MIRRWLRLASGLGPARSGSEPEAEWVPMRDGTRLNTIHIWPIDVRDAAPTIVMRTPHDLTLGAASPLQLGRLIAESGYHVALQDVRGRHASEGSFTPFASEQQDGSDTLEWIAQQRWCDGRIGLFGRGYAGHCAWAALAAAPQHVGAMVLANCARDPYTLLHRGGALAFELALGWAVALGDRESPSPERVDLQRGLEFRPVREADRVASRVVEWYRDWVDHPSRDAYWRALTPPLPDAPPPTLLVTRWNDPHAEALRADYSALQSSTNGQLRLIVGDWPPAWDERPLLRRRGMTRNVLREAIAHFDLHLRNEPPPFAPRPVRYFDIGERLWRESDAWPPPESEARPLYLHGDGNAGGGLDWSGPSTDEPPDRCTFDPSNPLRSGEPAWKEAGRSDCLVYESRPTEGALRLAGEISLQLHLSSDAEDADLSVRLFCDEDGRDTQLLGSGFVRARWREGGEDPHFLEPGQIVRLDLQLGACAVRLGAGSRLRLEIGCSDFPWIDRSSGSRAEPSSVTPEGAAKTTQTIHHGDAHPSHVLVPVAPTR